MKQAQAWNYVANWGESLCHKSFQQSKSITPMNGEYVKPILCIHLAPSVDGKQIDQDINVYKFTKNLSLHTGLFELVTSLLIRDQKFKLCWLIRLVKHALLVDSLYFLYLLLLSISKTLAASKITP
jgi:hypothetical protein